MGTGCAGRFDSVLRYYNVSHGICKGGAGTAKRHGRRPMPLCAYAPFALQGGWSEGPGGFGFNGCGLPRQCAHCLAVTGEYCASGGLYSNPSVAFRRQPSARLAADAIPGPASKPVRQWRGCGNSGPPVSATGSGSPQFPFAKGASVLIPRIPRCRCASPGRGETPSCRCSWAGGRPARRCPPPGRPGRRSPSRRRASLRRSRRPGCGL